jgi:hypothetical protein
VRTKSADTDRERRLRVHVYCIVACSCLCRGRMRRIRLPTRMHRKDKRQLRKARHPWGGATVFCLWRVAVCVCVGCAGLSFGLPCSERCTWRCHRCGTVPAHGADVLLEGRREQPESQQALPTGSQMVRLTSEGQTESTHRRQTQTRTVSMGAHHTQWIQGPAQQRDAWTFPPRVSFPVRRLSFGVGERFHGAGTVATCKGTAAGTSPARARSRSARIRAADPPCMLENE